MVTMKNEELPVCPSDGKPCWTPNKGCQMSAFGSIASDGVEEIVWTCPRFKEGSR